MFRYTLNKVALTIPTLIGVTIVAFAFIRLIPGDPILLLAGERGVTEERYAQLAAQFGFDRPLWQQYFSFMGNLLQGDLGNSFVTKQPVLTEFLGRFPATVELSMFAMILAMIVGLPAGVIAAVRRGTFFDHTLMTVSLTGYSMPIFWWGLLLIILFSSILGWTPVSGRISVMYFFDTPTGFMTIDALISGEKGAFRSALSHLILPSIALGTILMAVIARQTRSAILEVLGEDYIRTARAKGIPAWRIVGLHALRNALITVVTVIGLQVGVLFAGAILTETIFAWPGIGKWMIDSIYRRDYQVVQGGLILIAGIVMIVNLFVDFLYGLINPRIRHTRG